MMHSVHVYVESGTPQKTNETVETVWRGLWSSGIRAVCVTSESRIKERDADFKKNAELYGTIGASDIIVVSDGYQPDSEMVKKARSNAIPIYHIREGSERKDLKRAVDKCKYLMEVHGEGD